MNKYFVSTNNIYKKFIKIIEIEKPYKKYNK